MTRAAIDIGTNSMRLLIVDEGGHDLVRLARVTGLGRGVDAGRRLSDDAVARTLAVFEEFRRHCDERSVGRVRAVATSATRDAGNRQEFLDAAESVLGVRPQVIPGEEEARLSYVGATLGRTDDPIVVDIGGGSTEFVHATAGRIVGVSVDIGSVRLTDRLLPHRPATYDELEAASEHVDGLFASLELPTSRPVMGVAGTWTSLAAIRAGSPAAVHDAVLDRLTVDRLVARLAAASVEETASLPGLDPARAPVILAGAVIAREVMRALVATSVTVSERDLLDGVVAGL
ncbi:MAG TPA: Ppx/GppA phosphatase family protein [Acidimicrobiia bacterium]|nr:Ppx/GppA phosphatase family protein [Acidimicrobiia bacterium]